MQTAKVHGHNGTLEAVDMTSSSRNINQPGGSVMFVLCWSPRRAMHRHLYERHVPTDYDCE